MRLRFQKFVKVYEIRSEIKFAKRRSAVVRGVHYAGSSSNIIFKTLYGSNHGLSDMEVLHIARTNILHKFGRSGGQLVGLQIANIFI
jgi:hypothetical protein